MVSNLICSPNDGLTLQAYDGCEFVVVEPKDVQAPVNPASVRKLIRVSNPDKHVETNHAAGIVIPSTSLFSAVKNWKLNNPTKLLVVDLDNNARGTENDFFNGLWKQGGNFLDIILSKAPIPFDNETNDVPTVPPHKVAMYVDHQQAYKTAVNFADVERPAAPLLHASVLPAKSTAHFPVWGWVLAGIGTLVVVGVLTWFALTYMKKRQRETVP